MLRTRRPGQSSGGPEHSKTQARRDVLWAGADPTFITQESARSEAFSQSLELTPGSPTSQNERLLSFCASSKNETLLSFCEMKPKASPASHWLTLLSDEDHAFIRRFILTSGSLKELATAYAVTYPTVRLRLDRLIDKIKAMEQQEAADDYERLLRGLYAEGRLDATTFRQLLEKYQQTTSPTP